MKPTVVSADVLFEDHRAQLKWQWVAGLGASERRFDEVAVREATSGADLVGYLNYIHPYRVQILGEREIAYISRGASAVSCGASPYRRESTSAPPQTSRPSSRSRIEVSGEVSGGSMTTRAPASCSMSMYQCGSTAAIVSQAPHFDCS